ncbi:MAG: dihydrolipoyl dehydrogenase family protein [Marmoricola sp.]
MSGEEPDEQRPWELVVVGGGTAGLVGAKTAARLGARVLVIESARTGGDCLWTGCVPSKALLAAADVAAVARSGHAMGVTSGTVEIDFAEVMTHVRRAIYDIAPIDSPDALRAEGVTVLNGRAVFTGPRHVAVAGEEVSFVQALVTTGAAPAVPRIPGLETVPHLTNETVWELDHLPRRLVVLGGGTIGCELGQAFTRLGSEVTLVEGAARLLPREDAGAADVVTTALAGEGTRIITGAKVTEVRRAPSTASDDIEALGGCLVLADDREVPFTHLLVAVGRSPATRDLGLERAGVVVDERGFVKVDDRLRTTNPRIWAAGDLTGHPQFTHTAGVHASLAASNAVLGVRRRVDLTAVPRVTYTQPEVAAVGITTDEPPEGLRVLTWQHTHVDRAVTEGRTTGCTKLTVDARGRVVGAMVVGPRAGETIGELTLAVKRGLRTRDLAAVTHAYPTWNDGVWNAAIADVREQLEGPGATRRVIAALVRSRRWWLAHRDR